MEVVVQYNKMLQPLTDVYRHETFRIQAKHLVGLLAIL